MGSSPNLGHTVSSRPHCLGPAPPLHQGSPKMSRSVLWPRVKPKTLSSSHRAPQVWSFKSTPSAISSHPPTHSHTPPPPHSSLAFPCAENTFPTFLSGLLLIPQVSAESSLPQGVPPSNSHHLHACPVPC